MNLYNLIDLKKDIKTLSLQKKKKSKLQIIYKYKIK